MFEVFLPEMFRGDRHGLRPDGAGSGDHEEKEAANSHHLEGSMEDRPGLEPGLLLQSDNVGSVIDSYS